MTYRVAGDAIEIVAGADDASTVVVLSRAAWDPALRFLHAGIPVYDPARADFGGRDPEASFTLDATDDELRAQLTTMGYLHLRGVFSAEEMVEVNAEVDRLAALARPGRRSVVVGHRSRWRRRALPSAETGNLTVVPGSHGQTLHYQWERRMTDVPLVAIDTAPGDVTLHIQDVMHAPPKPEGVGGRRTMYVTFLPQKLWDHVGPGEAFNDLVRNRPQQVASLQN